MLERLLAAHPKVIGCGEVHNFLVDFDIKETCSCGASVERCPVWQAAYQSYVNKKQLDSYSIFKVLNDSLASEISHLSDVSKTTWRTIRRPFQLSKQYEVRMIHLVRDGSNCLASVLKRNKNSFRLLLTIKVALHWSVANLAGRIFSWLHPKNYRQVLFQDLLSHPEESLAMLFEWLGLESTSALKGIDTGTPIPLTHQLSGNAIRREEGLIIQKPQEDTSSLYSFEKGLFKCLTWPMRKVFGF